MSQADPKPALWGETSGLLSLPQWAELCLSSLEGNGRGDNRATGCCEDLLGKLHHPTKIPQDPAAPVSPRPLHNHSPATGVANVDRLPPLVTKDSGQPPLEYPFYLDNDQPACHLISSPPGVAAQGDSAVASTHNKVGRQLRKTSAAPSTGNVLPLFKNTTDVTRFAANNLLGEHLVDLHYVQLASILGWIIPVKRDPLGGDPARNLPTLKERNEQYAKYAFSDTDIVVVRYKWSKMKRRTDSKNSRDRKKKAVAEKRAGEVAEGGSAKKMKQHVA